MAFLTQSVGRRFTVWPVSLSLAMTTRCWLTVAGAVGSHSSGKAMAELIATGEARTVDLSPFHPARLLRVHVRFVLN